MCGGTKNMAALAAFGGFWVATPTRFRKGQNEQLANFGTAVESCSTKTETLSSTHCYTSQWTFWLIFENKAFTAAHSAHLSLLLRWRVAVWVNCVVFSFAITTVEDGVSSK